MALIEKLGEELSNLSSSFKEMGLDASAFITGSALYKDNVQDIDLLLIGDPIKLSKYRQLIPKTLKSNIYNYYLDLVIIPEHKVINDLPFESHYYLPKYSFEQNSIHIYGKDFEKSKIHKNDYNLNFYNLGLKLFYFNLLKLLTLKKFSNKNSLRFELNIMVTALIDAYFVWGGPRKIEFHNKSEKLQLLFDENNFPELSNLIKIIDNLRKFIKNTRPSNRPDLKKINKSFISIIEISMKQAQHRRTIFNIVDDEKEIFTWYMNKIGVTLSPATETFILEEEILKVINRLKKRITS